jgi:hypothetical protein
LPWKIIAKRIKPIKKKRVNPWTGAILFICEKFIYMRLKEKSRMPLTSSLSPVGRGEACLPVGKGEGNFIYS